MGLQPPETIATANGGPMSPLAIAALDSLGVEIVGAERLPSSAIGVDLGAYQRVVFMDEIEHRPMVESLGFVMPLQAEFWTIRDLPFDENRDALMRCRVAVDDLISTIDSR